MILCPRCAHTVGGPKLSCVSCDFTAHNGDWFDFEPAESIDPFFDEAEFDHRFVAEPTHYWSRARRELLLDVLRKHVSPSSRVLEVGCGCGYTSKSFEAAGYDVWSADLSKNALGYSLQNGLERLCRVSMTNAMWTPPLISEVAYRALAIERRLLNTPFPGLGTSLLAVARRVQ